MRISSFRIVFIKILIRIVFHMILLILMFKFAFKRAWLGEILMLIALIYFLFVFIQWKMVSVNLRIFNWILFQLSLLFEIFCLILWFSLRKRKKKRFWISNVCCLWRKVVFNLIFYSTRLFIITLSKWRWFIFIFGNSLVCFLFAFFFIETRLYHLLLFTFLLTLDISTLFAVFGMHELFYFNTFSQRIIRFFNFILHKITFW